MNSILPQRREAAILLLSALFTQALAAPTPRPQEDTLVEEDDDGSGGKSDAYVTLSTSAQIGIIVACAVIGVGILVGVVLFYIKKKRQWKREGRRRSVMSVVSMGGVPRRMWDEVRENFKSEKSMKKDAVAETKKEGKWVDVEKQKAKLTLSKVSEEPTQQPTSPSKSWMSWKK